MQFKRITPSSRCKSLVLNGPGDSRARIVDHQSDFKVIAGRDQRFEAAGEREVNLQYDDFDTVASGQFLFQLESALLSFAPQEQD